MKYEETPIKPIKVAKGNKLTHNQAREQLKSERKIADMNTGSILAFIAHKHRFALSLSANVVLVVFVIVKLI